jgi:hypothetical protein
MQMTRIFQNTCMMIFYKYTGISTVYKLTAFDLQDVKNRRFQRVIVYRVFIYPKKYLRRLKACLLIKEPTSRSMIDLELYPMVKISFVKGVS